MAKFTVNGEPRDVNVPGANPLLWVLRESLALTGTKFGCGIVYGLTAGLYGEINIEKGRAVQGNFDTYRMLRMNESPEVEVLLTPSGDDPGGVGEPGTPPIIPAVTNAIFALTGETVRELPIRLG